MNYFEQFTEKVKGIDMRTDPLTRISNSVKSLLDRDSYYIDTHVHLFDIRCVNKAYFLMRMIKDMLHLKSASESFVDISAESLYTHISESGEQDWESEVEQEFEQGTYMLADMETKGIIDWWKARKFLGFKRMEDVYQHYMDNFSLIKYLEKKDVLVTALMMDLEKGWGCSLKKKLSVQIDELKLLAASKPVLPFLACDPRRADDVSADENLYALFAKAFSNNGGSSFFGVKIYPAMGYDPSDYRLWPLYEYCEKYKIPVLSHHGGESVSTDRVTDLLIYEGEQDKLISAKNRHELAYMLNDPGRWKLVLEKYPQLKLNLAHFGGSHTWQQPDVVEYKDQKRKETIFSFMNQYDNVYADFSFQLIDDNISRHLREVISMEKNSYIRDKTLFGTDYWVVNPQGDLYNEQKQFLEILDHNMYNLPLTELLTETNSYNYLFA